MSVRFDFAKWEEFVRIWQTARTVAEVCEKFELTELAAKARARNLRALGVDLKKFPRGSSKPALLEGEIQQLRELARRALMSTAVRPGVVKPLANGGRG
jgi:hypothetical protein